jgi:hypothetical protein
VDKWGELYRTKRLIECYRERIEVLNSAKEYGEQIYRSGGKTNYPKDKISRIVTELDELREKIIDASLLYGVISEEIELSLGELPRDWYGVAKCRFMDGMSWEETAKETEYCVRQCIRIGKKIKEVTQCH